jgi:hypothetical protein
MIMGAIPFKRTEVTLPATVFMRSNNFRITLSGT